MKNFLLALVLITILACRKDNNAELDKNSSVFWTHFISAQKGDKTVDLWLTNPLPFSEFAQPVKSPKFLEIYYGSDSSALKFYKKVDIDVDKVTFTNLVNNTVYYFAVKTYGGKKLVFADTVRTTPSAPVELSEIATGQPLPYRPMFSNNNKFLSYVQNSDLYVKNVGNNTVVKTEYANDGIGWSHLSNKFIYGSTITVSNIPYFNKLKIYDADKNTDDVIADINYAAYGLGGVTFSKDDKTLYLNTSEGRTDKLFMDIWMINLDTKVKTKISNFASSQFYPAGKIMAGADGKSILLEGGYNLAPSWSKPRSIYRYNLETEQLQIAIKSTGYDALFAESPDGKHIAFASNWSGRSRSDLWLLNTTNKSLKLLTSVPWDFGLWGTGFTWIDNTSISIILNANGELKLFKAKI